MKVRLWSRAKSKYKQGEQIVKKDRDKLKIVH